MTNNFSSPIIVCSFILLLSLRVFSQSTIDVVTDPDMNQSLTSPVASMYARQNGANYNKRNYINPWLHNIFMANNRAETGELRLGLENISKLSGKKYRLIDMLGNKPINWNQVTEAEWQNIQAYHSIAAINTENISNPTAPVIILFSSASHNLLSMLTLDLMPYLTQKGFIVVVMEYPGFGGSLGSPSRDNWSKASPGLLTYIKQKLNRKTYLVGHSIGSAVALEVASDRPDLVSGVVSHAGFYDLAKASQDSSQLPTWLNLTVVPLLTHLFANEHFWDNDKTLPLLAKNNVPTFILQGAEDQSVNPKHLGIFQKQTSRLKEKFPGYPVYTQSFENASHEDIYVNDNYGSFTEIWTSILNFIKIQR